MYSIIYTHYCNSINLSPIHNIHILSIITIHKIPSHHHSGSQGFLSLRRLVCKIVIIIGGDEENRTPVRKRCYIDFSERSLCLDLRLKQTQTTAVRPISMKFPSVSENRQLSILQFAPHPPVQEAVRQG